MKVYRGIYEVVLDRYGLSKFERIFFELDDIVYETSISLGDKSRSCTYMPPSYFKKTYIEENKDNLDLKLIKLSDVNKMHFRTVIAYVLTSTKRNI